MFARIVEIFKGNSMKIEITEKEAEIEGTSRQLEALGCMLLSLVVKKNPSKCPKILHFLKTALPTVMIMSSLDEADIAMPYLNAIKEEDKHDKN